MTARELLKTDINNIPKQEFGIIVIRLGAGLEKTIEDSREYIAAEIKDLGNSHDELRKAVNEMQNKLDAVKARMEETEGRIGEMEDKIMEKNESEKRRERTLLDYEGRIRDLSDSIKT